MHIRSNPVGHICRYWPLCQPEIRTTCAQTSTKIYRYARSVVFLLTGVSRPGILVSKYPIGVWGLLHSSGKIAERVNDNGSSYV